jgi:hypothetical protein
MLYVVLKVNVVNVNVRVEKMIVKMNATKKNNCCIYKMPDHYNPHIPASKTKGLSEAMKKRMDKHAEKHSKKHIDKMLKLMKDGHSFNKAHKEAMKDEPEEKAHKSKIMPPRKKLENGKSTKGLTKAQEKLPPKLKSAIMKKNKK